MEKKLNDYVVKAGASIISICTAIKKNKARAVVVIDKNKVIGVISEGDILEALIQGRDIHDSSKGLINHSLKFLSEKDTKQAYQIFKRTLITMIPVVSPEMELIDIITLHEVFEDMESK